MATVKTHSRIYIKYFLHNITLQLLFILINKYSLCNFPKYQRERLGMVRRMETSIPKTCPQNKSTCQNNKDRNQIFYNSYPTNTHMCFHSRENKVEWKMNGHQKINRKINNAFTPKRNLWFHVLTVKRYPVYDKIISKKN